MSNHKTVSKTLFKSRLSSFKGLSKKKKIKIDPPWWKGGVLYQIYIQSFMDSNGDGVGDLGGIIKKLDYIANLGVEGVWISPFFQSPMKDFGYDVSDYCAIDPLFGKLSDFKKIVFKAKSLGLKVVIDQVFSHTSDQHLWFKESRKNRNNSKADWYVWADPKPDGGPPNNWLSIFGGSGWQWDTRRKQYYFHNFLKEQPDLNFHNPKVRKALLNTMEFWLKCGVDGFRLDTVNFYYHSKSLKSNPPRSPGKISGVSDVNPYAFQKHLYDKTQPENIIFLKEMRKLLDRYSRPGKEIMTVGEIGDDDPTQVVAEYTKGKDRLHSCYSFKYLGEEFSAQIFKDGIEEFEKKVKGGWAFWPFSNHDVERVATRWGKHFPGITFTQRQSMVKMILALQMTLRGSVCLYQGEELGFTEAFIPYEFFQDPYGIEMYPEFRGRDGCRTPMTWNSKVIRGGFSTATHTWLPLAPEHIKSAVDIQEKKASSVLHFTRRILQFRKDHPELKWGKIKVLSSLKQIKENILIIERRGDSSIYAVFFLNCNEKRINIPEWSWKSPLLCEGIRVVKKQWLLKPFAFGFYKEFLKKG